MRVIGIDPGLRNLGWGVIDVAGDGQNNEGISVARTYEREDFTGITVNGLAVGEHDGSVGQLQGEMDVLLDHDHGGSELVGDATHDREHLLDDDRCQAEAHLVDEQ